MVHSGDPGTATKVIVSMKAKRFLERLIKLARNPERLVPAIKIRIGKLPYNFGITSLWPHSYIAYTPDRYSDNASKTIRRTGLSLFKDITGFIHDNRANNAGDLTRFYLFNLILEQIDKEKLNGDLAELGVYKRNTAV